MDAERLSICPSILAADFLHLERELARVKNADMIHFDVMDGHFVPNISFGPMIAEQVKATSQVPLDVHLMVSKPEDFIPEFAKLAPLYITVHYETCMHLQRTLSMIRDFGVKPGLSLNPHTPIQVIEHVVPDIELLLIMTVNPGYGGQAFIPQMMEKIRLASRRLEGTSVVIQVDGGISLENTPRVVEAGARAVVAGSAIFGSDDAEAYIETMRAAGLKASTQLI